MPDLARTIYQSYPSIAFAEPAFPDSHTEHAFTPALRTSEGGVDNIFFRDYQPLSDALNGLHVHDSRSDDQYWRVI
jgi:extracellular matrix protein 14